jgi:hypothetical protein
MSQSEAIERYKNKINAIDDVQLGDYRRKAQTYLNRLKQELSQPDQDLCYKILEIENLISYSYPQDLNQLINQISEKNSQL